MNSKMVSFSIQGHGQDGPPPEVVFRRASRIVEDKTLYDNESKQKTLHIDHWLL